jgi:Tfp pilus assembly protein PilN
MQAIDWVALWNGGGFVGVASVAVALAVVYDRRRPTKEQADNPTDKLLHELVDKVDGLKEQVTDRMGRAETRLDDHQRQIDRLQDRMK